MAERDDTEAGLFGDAAPPKPEAYRVLARKYRPQTFDSLIGQEAMVRTLGNAFASGRIAHAFMLTGVRGVGKTTTARIVARALNCTGPDGRNAAPTIAPCGVCESCISIAESRNVDVQEMDAASRTGIDDIREIIEGVRYLPQSARYKVYIVDEVHMLSKQAFNGLLKTLEEPPPHVKFIFATTEIRKVPVTVLSRCQRFDLRRISAEALATHLAGIAKAEGVAVDADALALIARAAEGSARDALSLLDQAIAHAAEEGANAIGTESVRQMLGLADRARVIDLYDLVMQGSIDAALVDLRDQYDQGAEPLAVLQDMLELTHWLTRLKVAPTARHDGAATESEVKRGQDMAGRISMQTLTRAWGLLLKGLNETRDASMPIHAAEMALVRLAYAVDLPPTDRLVAQVKAQGGNAPAARPSIAPTAPAAPSPPRSSGPAQRAERKPAPEPEQTPSASAEPAPVLQLDSLEAVVAELDRRREITLKRSIERYVRLIRFERRSITLSLSRGAPADLTNAMSAKLRELTGEMWLITSQPEGGGATIDEQRDTERQARFAAALQMPLVQAALARFPGARIVEVREPQEAMADGGDDQAMTESDE